MKRSKQIKQLKKEIKRLRKLAGREAIAKQNWKNRYEELDCYVESVHKDY